MNPGGCLRSLTAEVLLWAYPQGPLFPVSLGVMAVANAFVMLGLLPEPLAEAILAEHRSQLERQGFGDSWGGHQGRADGSARRPSVLAVPDRRACAPAGGAGAGGSRWGPLPDFGCRGGFRVGEADLDGLTGELPGDG